MIVGAPSLYALCGDWPPEHLPDEEYHTWQAATAPLAIELFRFNLSAVSCPYLIVGVRAAAEQAALLEVSITSAGQVQELSSSAYGTAALVGLTTPAYPVSYYSYPLTDSDALTVLAFSLASDSTACATSQLQMVVSDITPFPNASDPSTFIFSRSAVTLANSVTDLTIAISDFSKPAGSLHVGVYYVAVSATANLTCQYVLQSSVVQQRQMPLGQLASYSVSLSSPATYITFAPVPYNTSASLAVQFTCNTGLVALYVAVDNTPSPAHPSTYLLSGTYDTTLAGSSGMYVAQPVYIPASACASPATVGQPCTAVVMAVSSVASQPIYLQAMSSANSSWLQPGISIQSLVTASSSSLINTTFQLSLPASPLIVTLSVNTSSPLAVWCSYQYVTPDATYSEWQWQVGGGGGSSASDGNSSSGSSGQLSFTWGSSAADGSPLQLTNAGTQLAAQPTVCCCTVQASGSALYSLAYTTSPLSPVIRPTPPSSSSTSTPTTTPSATSTPSTTSASATTPTLTSAPSPAPAADKQSGLSSGALAAAVVVPVVVVLLLVAVMLLLWMRRGGGSGGLCCGDVLGKRRASGEMLQHEVDTGEHEVSMAELSRSTQPIQTGRLIARQQQWSSDRE